MMVVKSICQNMKKFIAIQKQKKEQKLRTQLNFLFQQVFQYYYDLSEFKRPNGVDFPEFIYDKERKSKAERKALEELLYRLADRKVTSKLFNHRVNQIRNCV